MADAFDGNPELSSVTEPVSTLSNGSSEKVTIAKLSAQLKKLNEANSKYKNLLKLAKDRIEKQEEEISTLKHDHTTLLERMYELEEKDALSSTKNNLPISDESQASLHDRNFASASAVGTTSTPSADAQVLRILQRIECPVSEGLVEIWALVEFQTTNDDGSTARRFKEWKRFDTESQLRDYVRRDTGEPIDIPSYSLSPEQSASIQHRADEQVAKITDEYRRFRVRSELSRKQAETQIRELQVSLAQKVTQRIENVSLNGNAGNNVAGSEQLRLFTNQIERLKADMAIQESHWKESYEALLAENQALQSSGSEALLAAQWRQRYELCTKEKEDLELRLSVSSPSASSHEYEAKYRDLKESFRLYRKKAKEIFEAQQQSHGGVSSAAAMTITSSTSSDAKLSYLKNLMINFLTSDPTVREHMLGAIGTVLQFTPEERQRISAKNSTKDSSWF